MHIHTPSALSHVFIIISESEDPLGKDFTRYPKRKPKLSHTLRKEVSISISGNVISPAHVFIKISESEDPLRKDFTRYPKRKLKLSLPLQKEVSVTISDNALSPAKTEHSLASLPVGPMISEADQDPLLTRLELSSPVLRRRNKRTTPVTITDDTSEPDSSLCMPKNIHT